MNKKKLILILSIPGICCVILAAGLALNSILSNIPPSYSFKPVRDEVQTTFAIFMDATTNLAPYADENITEMLAEKGSNENLSIVIYLLTKDSGSDVTASKIYVGQPEDLKVKGQEVEEGLVILEQDEIRLSERTDLFTEFIAYANQSFPSKNYVVTLWGHGAAWMGALPAEDKVSTAIDAVELTNSINTFANSTKGRITVLNFDACLMGGLETLSVLGTKHVDYMAGSSTIVPGSGDNYPALIKYFRETPSADSDSIARIFVDSFKEKYIGKSDLPLAKAAFKASEYQQFVEGIRAAANDKVADSGRRIITNSYLSNNSFSQELSLSSMYENALLFGSTEQSTQEIQSLFDKLTPFHTSQLLNPRSSYLNVYSPRESGVLREYYAVTEGLDNGGWGNVVGKLVQSFDIDETIGPVLQYRGLENTNAGKTSDDPIPVSYSLSGGKTTIAASVPVDTIEAKFFQGLITESIPNAITFVELNPASATNELKLADDMIYRDYANNTTSFIEDQNNIAVDFGGSVPIGITQDYQNLFPNHYPKRGEVKLLSGKTAPAIILFGKESMQIDGYVILSTDDTPVVTFVEPDFVESFAMNVEYWDLEANRTDEILGFERFPREFNPKVETLRTYQDLIIGIWVKRLDGSEQVDYRYFRLSR